MGEELHSIARLLISSVAKERQQGIVLAVRGSYTKLAQKITELAGADPDAETRYLARKAIEKLGEFIQAESETQEDQFASLGIEKLLQSDNPQARFAGLKKIVAEKSRTGRFMLLSALAAETMPQLRASMIIGVGHFKNPEDVVALAPFLKNEDSRIRANTVEALTMIASEDAFRCIIAAMSDDDNRVKANVVKALQAIGGPSLFSLLKKMAVDESLWMRSSAVYAFSKIKSPQSLVALAQVVQSDPDANVRLKAMSFIQAEKEEGNPAALVILKKLAAGKKEETAVTPTINEKEFEPGSDDEMLVLLSSNEPARRYIALSRLREGEFFKYAQQFIDALEREQDAFLIAMMLTMIREKKFTDAFSRVRGYLNHSDDRIRANAVEAASAIEPSISSELITPLLKDKNGRVVANSIMALYKAGVIDPIIELKTMLKQNREAFKHSALYVISELREPSAVPLLEKLLHDYSPRVRDKAYDALKAYVHDRVAGSMKLHQEVEKQIELEKNREHFFENSLDQVFSKLLRMVKADSKSEEGEKKLFERNPQGEKLALMQLAEKCRQNNLLDSRTLTSVTQIDSELTTIQGLIEKARIDCAGKTQPVEESARQMSEEQLLNIEKKSLFARREALMAFFAFDFFSNRHHLDTKTYSLMRTELGRVEGSLCSYVPEKVFSMLPKDEAVVSEIFDTTMRLYQKHVWRFSFETFIPFARWLVWLFFFGLGFGIFSQLFMPAAIGFAILFGPYLAYKSLGLLVEWKIKMALMVDDFIHGRSAVREKITEKSQKLYKNVFGVSLKKHLLLGGWLMIALLVSGTIVSAGKVTGKFNIISSFANMIALIMAVYIFASVYLKYLLVEPSAIFQPEKDPFQTAQDIYRKDKMLIATLFIFATFIMTLITATSTEVVTFLMPVLPANASALMVKGLAFASDLCLTPIVFSNIVIFLLMRFRKMNSL